MEPGEWPGPDGGAASSRVALRRSNTARSGEGISLWVLPDHPAILAALGALICAGPNAARSGWRFDAAAARFSRPGRPTVVFNPASGDAPRDAVAAVSPLTLDVLVAMLATVVRSDREVARRVERPVGLVREAKEIRRYGAERQAFEQKVRAELSALGGLAVLGACTDEGRQLEPLLKVDRAAGSGSRAGLEISFGRWSGELSGFGAHRPFDPEILRLDHRSNRGAEVLAKKLALHLVLEMGAATARRSVRRLLTAVGELPDNIGSSCCRSGRLADRFEEALIQLEERRLFRVRYRSESSGALSRPKGWVSAWLDTTVDICPFSAAFAHGPAVRPECEANRASSC